MADPAVGSIDRLFYIIYIMWLFVWPSHGTNRSSAGLEMSVSTTALPATLVVNLRGGFLPPADGASNQKADSSALRYASPEYAMLMRPDQ